MSQEQSSSSGGGVGVDCGEIMLFGVRVKVDPMRKSVSMNNLSQYQLPSDAAAAAAAAGAATAKVAAAEDDTPAGYASADDAPVPHHHHHSSTARERKRGVPWTEEEHKLFLLGLQKVGKGDWRGISRNFVKTRTPTQVASHAQKYFLRKSNLNRRRRRTSLFDITTDSVTAMPMDESKSQEDKSNQPPTSSLPMPEIANVASNVSAFPVVPLPVTAGPVLLPVKVENTAETLTLGKVDQGSDASAMLLWPVPVVPIPTSSASMDLNLNQRFPIEPTQLSLRLSLSSSDENQPSTRHPAFQVVSSFSNGENIISVA